MKFAPYTAFGKTKNLPVLVMNELGEFTNDTKWDYELWVERYEDYYALMNPKYKGKKVRIIKRETWLEY